MNPQFKYLMIILKLSDEDLVRNLKKNVLKTVKFIQNIIVRGAISIHGTSRSHRRRHHESRKVYKDSRNLPVISNKGMVRRKPCIFQQVSAPSHTAKKVKAKCWENSIQLLPWAGNSPDMNPTEGLWNKLKNEIHEMPVTTTNQLTDHLIYVWFHSAKIKELC